MFLLSISRSDSGRFPQTQPFQSYGAGPFSLKVYVDGSNSYCSSSSDGFKLVESALPETDLVPIVASVVIEFSASGKVVTIDRRFSGGKSLYFHLTPQNDFVCASDVSALRIVDVPIHEDPAALPEYLVYRMVMPPRTLLKGIHDLPPGSRLTVRLTESGCQVATTLFQPSSESVETSLSEVVDKSIDMLKAPIARLKATPNEVAILMSGGVDSAILYRIAVETLGACKSYSSEYPFEDPDKNVERQYAQSAAKAFGADHMHFTSSVTDYPRELVRAVASAASPVHHLQSVMLHLVFREAMRPSEHAVICGVGAGGAYGNFRNFVSREASPLFRLLMKAPFPALAGLASTLTGHGATLSAALGDARMPRDPTSPDNPIHSWRAYGDMKFVRDLFRISPEALLEPRIAVLRHYQGRPIQDIWAIYSLLGDEAMTQSVWSKLAEAAGKRIIYPFYNDELLAYLFSVSWRIKLSHGDNVLRKSIARRVNVPSFIIERPKAGFGIRRPGWGEKGDVLEPLVAVASKAVDEALLRSLQSADPAKAMMLWSLLNYGIWKRMCVDGESASDLIAEIHD